MLELALYSAIAPLVLSVLSSVWMYPAVLEEVVKYLLLRYTRAEGMMSRRGLLVGLVFGVSETILYSISAWSSGDSTMMLYRIILTVPMHTLTGSLVGEGMGRGMGMVGLGCAMVVHGVFNFLMK